MERLTPVHYQLQGAFASEDAPIWRYTIHQFFHDNHPSCWLVEQFADALGGGDCSEFLEGIAVAMKKKWGLSAHFRALYKYYTSEAGKAQIAMIEQRAIVENIQDSAQEKSLGDLYEGNVISNTQPQDTASASSGSSSGHSSTKAKAAHTIHPEQQPAFIYNADVHEFFLKSPPSVWLNYRAFSRYVLSRDVIADPRSSYSVYIRSLRYIASHVQQLRIDMEAKKIRESVFRTDFLSVQGELMRKRKWVDGAEEQREGNLYSILWEEGPLLSDSSDDDFAVMSPALHNNAEDASDEEITGEIPRPKDTDQLAGPGTFSSELFCNPSSHVKVGGQDVNRLIMNHRRTHTIKAQAASEHEQLLVNFIVTKALLTSILPSDIASDTVKEVFPDSKPLCVSPAEQTFIAELCAQSGASGFEVIQAWLKGEQRTDCSVAYRAVINFFSEASLWAHTNWYQPGSGSNEDTFTNALLKPILAAAFGMLAGSMYRWSRDPLHVRNASLDSILEFPDYQVSFGEHSYILGEFKTAVASTEDMRKDYKKLAAMGKKVVDDLFQEGFPTFVILIHGQGMEVDVYSISLYSEAFYKMVNLGRFRLVSSPYEFGLLLSLGPLISAQATATSSYNMLKRGERSKTDKTWMRGTFDVKDVTVP
ncbi:hypothetical protein EDD11_009888 [Mortierella claussenii]|nr:hypothetical protein EDD11_009888 [Mortierella claussenii]